MAGIVAVSRYVTELVEENCFAFDYAGWREDFSDAGAEFLLMIAGLLGEPELTRPVQSLARCLALRRF